MKKRYNEKIRLVLSIAVCSLFVVLAFSTTTVKSTDIQGTQTKTNPSSISPKNPKLLGLFNFRILNLDWNYWDNKPNLFLMPTGNVGIGTTNPLAKLDVFGNIAINGEVIIDADGHWVGNLSGMQGPPGPQGLPGESNWILNGNNIYNNNTGNVGIGVTSPLSKFQVNNGAVLFSGTTGETPTSGEGARLMWIPSKQAFRAGYVNGNLWDDSNIGIKSVAMGYSTNASGQESTAMGHATTASGTMSTAMGISTIASGTGSTAMGAGTITSGEYSFAVGIANQANNYCSIATGLSTVANGLLSTAMGRNISVNGQNSFGIGLSSHSPNWIVNSNYVMSIMGGNVGIGTTSPTAPLDVVGDVKTSGDYRYTSPKTYYLNIPTAAFAAMAEGYSDSYFNSGYWISTYNSIQFTVTCPVYLPQGATITEFQVYVYDNDATYNVNSQLSLQRRNINSIYFNELAGALWFNTSGSSSNIQVFSDTTIQYPTIENANYQYFITINFISHAQQNTNLRFCGCRIAYNMDTIAP